MNDNNFTIPENHPDLAILCAKTGTKPEDMRGACSPGKEYNYLKFWHLRDWSESDKQNLIRNISAANAETKEYQFRLVGVCDFEVEYDNDRTWPASFSFESHKK